MVKVGYYFLEKASAIPIIQTFVQGTSLQGGAKDCHGPWLLAWLVSAPISGWLIDDKTIVKEQALC
uniref:Uncharacterized protein n=1 Tax=Cyanothece sp. (strain PCC 7425 / ATCC 29141) TaxID=395961 RepID=B8HQ58_CYAP4